MGSPLLSNLHGLTMEFSSEIHRQFSSEITTSFRKNPIWALLGRIPAGLGGKIHET